MKAVDPHRHGLEPFFDVVPVTVVEMTAQSVAGKGSQVVRAVDEKFGVIEFVTFSEGVKERRRGTDPAAAGHFGFEQEFRLDIDRRVQPLLLAIDLDAFLVDRDPRVSAVGGSIWASESVCVQFQIPPCD
jgi:hypothetical protein